MAVAGGGVCGSVVDTTTTSVLGLDTRTRTTPAGASENTAVETSPYEHATPPEDRRATAQGPSSPALSPHTTLHATRPARLGRGRVPKIRRATTAADASADDGGIDDNHRATLAGELEMQTILQQAERAGAAAAEDPSPRPFQGDIDIAALLGRVPHDHHTHDRPPGTGGGVGLGADMGSAVGTSGSRVDAHSCDDPEHRWGAAQAWARPELGQTGELGGGSGASWAQRHWHQQQQQHEVDESMRFAQQRSAEPAGYTWRKALFWWLWPESRGGRMSADDVMRMEYFMTQREEARLRKGCNLEALRRTSELKQRILPAQPPTEAELTDIQLAEFAAANDKVAHARVLDAEAAERRRRRRAERDAARAAAAASLASKETPPAPAAPAASTAAAVSQPDDLLPIWAVLGIPTMVFVVQLYVIYCHKPSLFGGPVPGENIVDGAAGWT